MRTFLQRGMKSTVMKALITAPLSALLFNSASAWTNKINFYNNSGKPITIDLSRASSGVYAKEVMLWISPSGSIYLKDGEHKTVSIYYRDWSDIFVGKIQGASGAGEADLKVKWNIASGPTFMGGGQFWEAYKFHTPPFITSPSSTYIRAEYTVGMDSWRDPDTLAYVYYGPGTQYNSDKGNSKSIQITSNPFGTMKVGNHIYESQTRFYELLDGNPFAWPAGGSTSSRGTLDQEFKVVINHWPSNYHPENYVLTSG
jgi:hypothetical protein